MFCDLTNCHQIMTFHQYIHRRHDLPLIKSVKRLQHCVTSQCSRQNFEIGGCRGMESKVVLSDSIDYAIITVVNLL